MSNTATNIQQLDLNLLKVFETLYREQNMTQTANILFLTPSAVSHAVKRLRESLGDPLFVRQGQQMQPTPVCRRIAPALLSNLQNLRATLQQFSLFEPEYTEQTFSIAIHDALEPLFVPFIFKHLAITAPRAKLTCVRLDRNQVQRQMASGAVDVTLDVAIPIVSPIHHIQLSADPFSVLLAKHHPLSQGISKDAYLNAKHVAVSNRPGGRVIEDIGFQQQGLNRNIVFRCQSYHTAMQVVSENDMILTVPSSIGVRLLNNNLVLQELPIPLSKVETHLYWHDHTEGDASLKWFRKQIIDLVAQNMASKN